LTCVIDASAVVEFLIGSGPSSLWAESVIRSEELAAPHFMIAEAANLLRRAALFKRIEEQQASQAHAELLLLRVALFPYAPYAGRVWELRNNVTVYDGWYVALAEDLAAPLVTVDANLIRSPGPRCEFLTYQP
jgi:predicted nucleic acid-binding protein